MFVALTCTLGAAWLLGTVVKAQLRERREWVVCEPLRDEWQWDYR